MFAKRALFALFAVALLLGGIGCRNRQCRDAERYPEDIDRR